MARHPSRSPHATIDFAGRPPLMEIRDIRRPGGTEPIVPLRIFASADRIAEREMLMDRVAASVEQARQGEGAALCIVLDRSRSIQEINDITVTSQRPDAARVVKRPL